MIPMTTAQRERHLKGTTLKANGQVLAEWNLNRVYGGATVRNHLLATQPEYDFFDIASVVEVDRPPAGIVKGMTDGFIPGAGTTSSMTGDLTRGAITYVASERDQYKYWLSPNRSQTTMTSGGFQISNAAIEAIYPEAMPVNKFVFGFETGVSVPRRVTVSYRAGGSWTSFTLSTITLDADGRLVLWRQGNGSFSTTRNLSTNTIAIDGLRLVVEELTQGNKFAAVIEASPRLVVDISDYVTGATYNAEMSDSSKVAPLGAASSNVGSVSLDNSDRYFSNDNPASPFYKMIGRGIDISFFVYPTEVDETPSAADRVTIFENMSTSSPSKTINEVTLDVKDRSRILQERKPTDILIQDCSVTEAVIRICHSVGFNDIEYDETDFDARDKYSFVPYFWTDSALTAWENISKIAEATQTAVYFDEYGKLQIKTRRAAFDSSKSVVWGLDYNDVTASDVSTYSRPGTDLNKKADIIDMSRVDEDMPNSVSVNYYETSPGKMVRGIPEYVVAWEPESDSVVVRAARIISNIPLSATTIHLHPTDAASWPLSGKLQVNGEVIAYDAKQYTYHLANGSKTTTWIEAMEEKIKYDSFNPGMAWANAYTGHLRISKRGDLSTVPAEHWFNAQNYLVRRRVGTGPVETLPSLLSRNPTNQYATVSSGSTSNDAIVVARKTVSVPNGKRLCGTTITFPDNGAPYGCAGVAVGVGSNDQGVYVELAKTTATGDRTKFNELNIYWKNGSGVRTYYGGKGVPFNVTTGVRYDLDVYQSTDATNHIISAYINGDLKLTVSIPKASSVAVLDGVNAMFFRGTGSAYFEHFYNIGVVPNAPYNLDVDVPRLYDIARGGYRSMVQTMGAKWGSTTATSYLPWDRPGAYAAYAKAHQDALFLDEFGLYAHEVREFDVTYEDKPMSQSAIYMSNTTGAAVVDFNYSPFGATFTIVNTSRNNAVIHGEDNLTLGTEGSITQKLMVFGRHVKQEEAKEVEERNQPEVVKSGKIELSVDNPHIQTEEHAKNIAYWIVNESGGELSLDVSVYANPHLQLGDTVAVHYPDEDMLYSNSRFFIVGKDISYNGGLELDLTLRSVI